MAISYFRPENASGQPHAFQWSTWPRIAVASLGAAAAGFAIHVLYGRGWAENYVQSAARSGRLDQIMREPYPPLVVVIVFVTALLPAAGKVIAYLLLREGLPGLLLDLGL